MIMFKKTLSPRFLKINNNDWKPSIFMKRIVCPTCMTNHINKFGEKWVGRCSGCGHIHNFFTPIPVQYVISQIRAKILGIFGGTGSGKTTVSSFIIQDHMRNAPGFKVMAFAQSLDQLKQTGKEELAKMFFEDEWKVKNESVWIHINGSKVSWYTSQSDQKVKGTNIGIAWLIEASGILIAIKNELQSRTRQDEVKVVVEDEDGNPIWLWDEKEKRWEVATFFEFGMTIIETNPTVEWPRDEVLMKSHTVIYTNSVRGIDKIAPLIEPVKDPENKKEVLDMVSILFASPDNPLMTSEYISSIRSSYNTTEEYERTIYCDMSYMTGMIFGEFIESMFIDAPELNVDGKRTQFMESMDPGGPSRGNDETGYALATVKSPLHSDELPTITIWDGYKKSGLVTSQEANEINAVRKRYGWTLKKSFRFVVDPGGTKSDKKSGSNLIKDLRHHEIYLSKDGVNTDVHWGIKLMYGYLKSGKLRIVRGTDFANELLREIKTYVWTNKMTKSKMDDVRVQKPVDRNNHLLDTLRFLTTAVSQSPLLSNGFDGDMKSSVYITEKHDSHNVYNLNDDDEKELTNLNGQGGIYFEQ